MTRRSLLGSLAVAGTSVMLGTSAANARTPTPSGAPAVVRQATRQRQSNVKIGFVLSHEQFPGPQLVSFAAAAEQAGFDMDWTSDHFQPWQPNEGHSMFPWVTLAALGQRTNTITLGTGVTSPTYRHHPSEVAQAFASLGVFYPGRVFLGVGTGEALNEAAATGNFGKYQERADRLSEAVGLIRKLWSGDDVTHDGQYYHTRNARLYDLPSQPVPIYMAASGPKSARLAGQYGDGWITGGKELMMPEMHAAFEAGARAAGKDPVSMPIIAETFVVVGSQAEAEAGAELWRFTAKSWKPGYVDNPDEADIQRRAEAEIPLEEVYKEWPIGPDPERHAQALQKLIQNGATHIFVHSPEPDQLRAIQFYGQLLLAAPAVAAGDRERHHDAVPDPEVPDIRPDLDDLAHELVPDDVALLHRGDEPVVEVQVGAADRRRRDLDDRVAAVQDLRIRHLLHPDGALALPAVRPHRGPPRGATAATSSASARRAGRSSRSGQSFESASSARVASGACPAPGTGFGRRNVPSGGRAGCGRSWTLASDSTTSPVSITCLKRRRSSWTSWPGSRPSSVAITEPAEPAGGS